MSLHSSINWDRTGPVIVEDGITTDPALAYREALFSIGAAWATIIDDIGSSLVKAGHYDITAEQALRLFSLARVEDAGSLMAFNPPSADGRSAAQTSGLYRNDYLTRSADTGTTIVTAKGISVVSLVSDILDQQAYALAEDGPIKVAQLTTVGRALKLLAHWMGRRM